MSVKRPGVFLLAELEEGRLVVIRGSWMATKAHVEAQQTGCRQNDGSRLSIQSYVLTFSRHNVGISQSVNVLFYICF